MNAPTLGSLDVQINARVGSDAPFAEIATLTEIPIPVSVSGRASVDGEAGAIIDIKDGALTRAIGQALVDAGLAMLGEKQAIAGDIEVTSEVVGSDERWSVKIDGHEFPWFTSSEGPIIGPINGDEPPSVTLTILAEKLTVDRQLGGKPVRRTAD